MSLKETSGDKSIPALEGENTAGGDGVVGKGNRGVVGESDGPYGVYGHCTSMTGPNAGVLGENEHGPGVWGLGRSGVGVAGISQGQQAPGVEGIGRPGVWGASEAGDGVWGQTNAKGFSGVAGRNVDPQFGYGVWGRSEGNAGGGGAAGVAGFSDKSDGVWGQSNAKGFSGVAGRSLHPEGGYGVWGMSDAGTGVGGFSNTAVGVYGKSASSNWAGVMGEGNSCPGVFGKALTDAGVLGFHGDPRLQETTVASDGAKAGVFGASENGAGVLGYSRDKNSPAVFAFGGLRALALDKPLAGWFQGDVQVDGDIRLSGADCAEHFDLTQGESCQPGTVMVIEDGGKLKPCVEAYDKKAVGVVSGAGEFSPAIVLDNQPSRENRLPIALIGKAYCNVDAQYQPIEVGDLLTTSETPGHAMKATDPLKAFGTVIGKALRPLKAGRSQIPILIALQ